MQFPGRYIFVSIELNTASICKFQEGIYLCLLCFKSVTFCLEMVLLANGRKIMIYQYFVLIYCLDSKSNRCKDET